MSAKRRQRDYYEILGVDKKANDADLKRAYRDLARRYHPDLNPGERAEERFKEINEAYAVLSDPKRRQRYDRYGHSAVTGASDSQGGGFENVVDAFDDLISDILKRRKKQKERGKDLRYTLELTLPEAAFGCEKTIKVPSTEGAPEREFVVSIPMATEDGSVRRIRGEGGKGKNGGPAGDLHVIIRVKEHPVLRREGHDIWCEVPVSFPQAALGAVVEVPSIEGKVRMRVPEGTQSGRILRMRGKGYPKSASKSAGRGDQMVRVIVETPTNLSEGQKRLLKQFASERGHAVSHPQQRGFVDKLRGLFRDA